MKVQAVIVLLGIAVCLQAISLPVSSMKERCMIVSSTNSEQFLKADLRFTRFADQALEEGYRIVLHNTETHEQQAYQIAQGTFRKQFQLTEHVVYRFCFKVVLSRHREIKAIMEYRADVTHGESYLDSNVTIPAGLLKVQDLQQSYRNMKNMEFLLKTIKEGSSNAKKEEDLIFEEQNNKMKTLTLVSGIEIIVILTFGAYQYWRLKVLIENKH